MGFPETPGFFLHIRQIRPVERTAPKVAAPAPSLERRNCREARSKPKIAKNPKVFKVPANFQNKDFQSSKYGRTRTAERTSSSESFTSSSSAKSSVAVGSIALNTIVRAFNFGILRSAPP